MSSEVLSPTPPVECLSAFGASMSEKSRTSPEYSISRVRISLSVSLKPRMNIAINNADV
jgi:hypothetical protein